MGHVDTRRDPCCPARSSGLAPSRTISLECMLRKSRKYPLSPELAESLQGVVASIRVQNRMRVCKREICHRGAYGSVCGGQKIGVDVARMRPAQHRSHPRDLSALIDIASRDDEEVGIRGN